MRHFIVVDKDCSSDFQVIELSQNDNLFNESHGSPVTTN